MSQVEVGAALVGATGTEGTLQCLCGGGGALLNWKSMKTKDIRLR
jgi:hypothetical protein